MNIHDRRPDKAEAEAALGTLRRFALEAGEDEVAGIAPALRALEAEAAPLDRAYPQGFRPDDAYRATLPDLQNGPASLIRGADRAIQHVGISNFRLPIRFRTRDNADLTLESAVTGTVGLDAGRKGINMSRIMRSFYAHAERRFSFEVMEAVLDDYHAALGSGEARLAMRLSFPMRQESLRSGLTGYQYYDITLETLARAGTRQRIMHLDYVYSSTCPCSLELAEHARAERGQMATPHAQRSVARISVALSPESGCLWFEDLIDLCRAAVPTETQVMVKREDEQAFAEMNAANPIFVEDAARLFAERLSDDPRIGDYRVAASHQESLHSHDAVSVLTDGPTFAAAGLEPNLFASLIHRG